METERVYQRDAYRRQIETRVSALDGRAVALAATVFFPTGGGVPGDSGQLECDQFEGGRRWVVQEAVEGHDGDDAVVWHVLDDEPPPVGTVVQACVDWPRRYLLMRYHTAAHVLCGVMFQRFGVRVTGNQLTTEKGRIDFSFAQFDRSLLASAFEEANAVVRQNLAVEVRFISADEAQARPELFKLEAGFRHQDLRTLRLVDIVDFDVQADGGCHVARLGEIGSLQLKKSENKGRGNRRVYFTVQD